MTSQGETKAILFHQNKEKSSVLLETTVQELNNIDPYVCAFCVKEDPPSSDGLSTVDWIECGNCKVWVHTL